jgi:hypothetical protein
MVSSRDTVVVMASNTRPFKDAESPEVHEEELQPRTPLGSRLWELRKRIVASGEPLLDEGDLEREIAERRGGLSEED